jgi:hypothetical protein
MGRLWWQWGQREVDAGKVTVRIIRTCSWLDVDQEGQAGVYSQGWCFEQLDQLLVEEGKPAEGLVVVFCFIGWQWKSRIPF